MYISGTCHKRYNHSVMINDQFITSNMPSLIRLLAVLFVVIICVIAKTTSENRLCGSRLLSAMAYLCKGKFNKIFDHNKKRFEGKTITIHKFGRNISIIFVYVSRIHRQRYDLWCCFRLERSAFSISSELGTNTRLVHWKFNRWWLLL